jgi:WD40 repeat protein
LRASLIDVPGGQAARAGRWERLRVSAAAAGAAVALAVLVLVASSFATGRHLSAHPTQTVTLPGSTSAANAPAPDAQFRSRDGKGAQVAAFSPNGRELAVGDGGALDLWDLATHRLIVFIAARGSGLLNSLAFSPDGSVLAAGDSNGEVYRWSSVTGHLISRFLCTAQVGTGSAGSFMTDLAFSRTGKLIAVTADSHSAHLCSSGSEALTPVTFPVVKGAAVAITAVAFSHDGTVLAIGSGSGRVYLFNSSNSARLRLESALSPSGPITSIAFSAIGNLLALASADGVTFLFDLTTLREVGTPIADPGRSRGIHSVTFIPDGNLLAAADGNGSTYVSNISTGKLLSILPDPASGGVAAATFSPNSSQLATADLNGVTFLWPLSPRSSHPIPGGSASGPSAIAEATAINNLLISSANTRSQFDAETLINDVGSCVNVTSAVSQIRNIAAGRTAELAQAMSLKVDTIPNGDELRSTLISALKVSLEVDKDYLAWAKQQKSTGCAEGFNSVFYQEANTQDLQASTVKTEFISLWDPISAVFGLERFNAGQI